MNDQEKQEIKSNIIEKVKKKYFFTEGVDWNIMNIIIEETIKETAEKKDAEIDYILKEMKQIPINSREKQIIDILEELIKKNLLNQENTPRKKNGSLPLNNHLETQSLSGEEVFKGVSQNNEANPMEKSTEQKKALGRMTHLKETAPATKEEVCENCGLTPDKHFIKFKKDGTFVLNCVPSGKSKFEPKKAEEKKKEKICEK